MTDPLLALNVAAVAGIHCIWRAYCDWLKKRQQTLRERVAYMLWMAAHQVR
jgi:hypothetical protein